MIVEVVHPDTRALFTLEIPTLLDSDVKRMSKEYTRDEDLRNYIARLPVAAELKATLFRVSRFTVKAGGVQIKLGKRLLEITLMLAQKYPETTLGTVAAALIAAAIDSLPYLESSLSTFLRPLLEQLGLDEGFREDLRRELPRLIKEIEDSGSFFRALVAGGLQARVS